MYEKDPCEICGSQANTLPTDGTAKLRQDCPRCGEFGLSDRAMTTIRAVGKEDRLTKLSGWVRNQNSLGDAPVLTSEQIKRIVSLPLPGIAERANRLLNQIIKDHRGLGERFSDKGAHFIATTCSANVAEFEYVLQFLCDVGFIKSIAKHEFEVMPKGYMHHERLQSQPSPTAQGFVAMWFDESVRRAYDEGFAVGVIRAGYDPLRVDKVEHVGKIDDEIIAQIKQSRFVVADFTGHRAGVYFEAGFALGLNLPVIWSCRHDDIGGLHFDIRQFNCIDWTTPDELANRLHMRIEAVVGAGPPRPLLAAS